MSLSAVDRVMNLTIGDAFRRTVDRFPDRDFLAAPPSEGRGYHEAGFELTYAAASRFVDDLVERYREAGYGLGDRIALALDNRPEHVLHRLALNTLGISCVPINPDYRPGELAYLLGHSEAALVVHLERHRETIEKANAELGRAVQSWSFETGGDAFLAAPRAATKRAVSSPIPTRAEAQLLYTSGTTGRPKGCIMSHEYELMCGSWYADLDGPFAFREGEERVYNPLPLYHVNAGVVSILGMMLIGGCQIQPDRFHPRSWWRDVVATRASVIHYLGVVAPMLLNQPDDPLERAHQVRFGWGAGIEPDLHQVFEKRFGFPMVELWGMTEMCRVLRADHEPRKRGTRAMGRAVPGLDVEVRDENDAPLPDGEPGEMVVRFSRDNPRLGAFSGYLKDEAATEEAWRAAGSIPATRFIAPRTACCISSTARRTSSVGRARTSPPPKSRRLCRYATKWPRSRSWRCPTRSARKRCWPASSWPTAWRPATPWRGTCSSTATSGWLISSRRAGSCSSRICRRQDHRKSRSTGSSNRATIPLRLRE